MVSFHSHTEIKRFHPRRILYVFSVEIFKKSSKVYARHLGNRIDHELNTHLRSTFTVETRKQKKTRVHRGARFNNRPTKT